MNNGPEAAISQNIAQNFGVLKCLDCSIALLAEFTRRGIAARRIQLSVKHAVKWKNIVMKDASNKLPFTLDSGSPISTNGKYFGVEAHGYVYDNIFRAGIAAHLWPKQFECHGSQFEITYLAGG